MRQLWISAACNEHNQHTVLYKPQSHFELQGQPTQMESMFSVVASHLSLVWCFCHISKRSFFASHLFRFSHSSWSLWSLSGLPDEATRPRWSVTFVMMCLRVICRFSHSFHGKPYAENWQQWPLHKECAHGQLVCFLFLCHVNNQHLSNLITSTTFFTVRVEVWSNHSAPSGHTYIDMAYTSGSIP